MSLFRLEWPVYQGSGCASKRTGGGGAGLHACTPRSKILKLSLNQDGGVPKSWSEKRRNGMIMDVQVERGSHGRIHLFASDMVIISMIGVALLT